MPRRHKGHVHTDEHGAALWSRCYTCGHRLRFAASGCPRCGETFDARPVPGRWPEHCECRDCQHARDREGA